MSCIGVANGGDHLSDAGVGIHTDGERVAAKEEVESVREDRLGGVEDVKKLTRDEGGKVGGRVKVRGAYVEGGDVEKEEET